MSRVVSSAVRYVDWLSDRYRADVRVLGLVRIFFALYVLLRPVDVLWVGAVPEAFFQPRVGPIRLLAEPPPFALLVALQVAQGVLAIALLIGFRTRVASALLTASLVTASSLVYSFGKVDHTILVELLPLPMAAAGWGAAYSWDAWRLRARARVDNGFPILLWGMVVGFALFSAALPKAVTGWLDPARHATRGYLGREIADPQRIGPLGEVVFAIDWDPFWKLLDYGTLVAEAGVVVALLYPPLLRLWLLAVLGFHAGVYLTMGISFAGYVFVYLPLLAGPLVAAAARVRRQQPVPVTGAGSADVIVGHRAAGQR